MQNIPLDKPETNQPNPWEVVGKVVGINLAILLGFALLMLAITWQESGQYAGMSYAIFMMGFVGLQSFVNLVLGIGYLVRKESDRAKAYLLSMLAVAIIGASACFGGVAVISS